MNAFNTVREFVHAEAGIVLEPGKEYLVDARLSPLVRSEGFQSVDALVKDMLARRGTDLRRKVLDAMTTNETTFFRDGHPFEVLKTTVLPDLAAARAATRTLRIWYAAASTGQEPYSVVMLMNEDRAFDGWSVEHFATDISRSALARAREGRYSQLEVNRGLPAPLLAKYFDKCGLEWQIHDSVRRKVIFSELNLNAPWPHLPPFDIIFLRNVMIYFDLPAKRRILAGVHDRLRPDGFLFLGGAESPMNIDDRFVRVPGHLAGCYRVAAGK